MRPPDEFPLLAALESAYRAGVLSKEEYSAKKAAIESRKARIAALDEALRSGVLTKDEYTARKTALEPPQPAPPAAVTETPAAPSAPSSVPVPAETAPAADAASHTYRMKLAKVVDAQGFAQPLTSVTLLIPTDWQSQGATTWNIKDACNSIQTHVIATGPDGRAFEQFPAYHWVWADDPRRCRRRARKGPAWARSPAR